MKKLSFTILVFLAIAKVNAQGNNPYSLFGYTSKNEYVITGNKKLEIKNIDTTSQVFSLYFDNATKRVCLKDKNGILLMAKEISNDVIAKWISVDPKANERLSLTPYNFVQNNPILRIDPDGQLDFNPSEQQLKDNNLTKDDITRFKNVVDNISSIVKDNPTALDVLTKNTGFTKDKILSDLQANTGTKVNISQNYLGMSGTADGIYVDPAIIKAYAALDPNNLDVLSKQTLGLAMSIIHEYTHNADQICNNGLNSGEWNFNMNNGRKVLEWDATKRPNEATAVGFQKWSTSYFEDRGYATTVFGYGQDAGMIGNSFYSNQAKKENFSGYPNNSNFPVIPTSLPIYMQGTTILQTLRVK